MAREGNNCGVLLKTNAAMFIFSLSTLTDIGRQDGKWELLLKYVRNDVHNFKNCRAEYLCGVGGGCNFSFKILRARFSKPDMVRLNFKGLGTRLGNRYL